MRRAKNGTSTFLREAGRHRPPEPRIAVELRACRGSPPPSAAFRGRSAASQKADGFRGDAGRGPAAPGALSKRPFWLRLAG